MTAVELYYYQTATGERPFVDWLAGLNDVQARARIEARLARVRGGDKRTQQKDIDVAKAYFKDYKARSAKLAKKKPRGRS
jgi:putative component of toxin-antitoxin plasmid stabilization module